MIRTLIFLLFSIAPTFVHAQDFDLKNSKDWTLVKGNDGEGCFATISVGLKSVRSGLVTVSLFPRNQSEGSDVPAVMSVQVPLGARLPSGIAYTHRRDNTAVGLAWQYCTDRTCVASGGVSSEELTKLKRGARIYLGFVPLPGSASLVVPVSLQGITKVWNEVQACG